MYELERAVGGEADKELSLAYQLQGAPVPLGAILHSGKDHQSTSAINLVTFFCPHLIGEREMC